MTDHEPQTEPDGAASVLTVRLEHIGDETTLCWNCSTVYSMAADQCPGCCATNANHDLESAQMEMKDKTHIDHDWKFQDDEFGTERVHYWQCERCGADNGGRVMKEGKELYKKADLPDGAYLAPCPVCGADAELWQYAKDFKNGPIDKVVMCTNGERFGPQDGAINEGCLLYMPPQDFYRGRIVEAVKFWNEYANVLNAQRRGRNWKRARVLREATPNRQK